MLSRPFIPDDVEASRSVSFDGVPSTRPPLPAHPGYSRPSAPPPLPPVQLPPAIFPQSRGFPTQISRVNETAIPEGSLILRVNETVIPESRLKSPYNFRGIADPVEVVNIRNGIPELDLHGLKVWEAKKVTEMFLQQSRGRRQVRIITGRGVHAPGGIPRIKPEIEKLLDAKDHTFTEVNKGGCLVINL